jgi:F1F0 ATPase subunit 2
MSWELGLALLGGFGLGLVFFGGLLWTLHRLPRSSRPALLFVGSLAARAGVVAFGLWWLGAGDWRRMAAAGLGLLTARPLLIRAGLKSVQSRDVPR